MERCQNPSYHSIYDLFLVKYWIILVINFIFIFASKKIPYQFAKLVAFYIQNNKQGKKSWEMIPPIFLLNCLVEETWENIEIDWKFMYQTKCDFLCPKNLMYDFHFWRAFSHLISEADMWYIA